ncbi:MAG TPA: glycosyltransferase family 4 protein, partial [Flavobacterium sp.]|nr:glycosyltransferase family 4 protein [Flavobacterium sp.]
PGFPHGGVGTFVATLGKALVEKGINVSVVGLNYESKEETEVINGIKVHRLSPKKVKGLQWYFNSKAISSRIEKIHQSTPIDFVETPELGLAFLSKHKEIKYVIRMHGGHHYFAQSENRKTEWWKAFQEKRSFQKADHIISVSDYVGETTRSLLHLKDKTSTTIYNPVDVSKFFDASNCETVPHTILFAGTIVEKKGIRQLVESLNYLIDKFPDIQLLIAGRNGNIPGTSQPYLPILERSIVEKIKNNITFLGVMPNDQMPRVISDAHICCYPSHMEAMPVAWLEVLAMGKIFVGSSSGPGPEAVQDGVTGVLANPFNPKDIAEKIEWVFSNPELAVEMGKKARLDIINRFSLDVIVNQNITYFSSILK